MNSTLGSVVPLAMFFLILSGRFFGSVTLNMFEPQSSKIKKLGEVVICESKSHLHFFGISSSTSVSNLAYMEVRGLVCRKSISNNTTWDMCHALVLYLTLLLWVVHLPFVQHFEVGNLFFWDKTHWQGSLGRNAIVAQYHHQISQNFISRTNAQMSLIPVGRPQNLLDRPLKKKMSTMVGSKVDRIRLLGCWTSAPARIRFCHLPAPPCALPRRL